MAKEDYREKVEEHRQEIDLHNESGAKVSRVSRHRKKGAKKQRNPLMTILVIIFIFIPLGILGYVLFIFEPSDDTGTTVAKEDENDQLVEIVKQDPNELKAVKSDENDEKKADEDAKAKVQAEKEKLAAEEAKKAEQNKAAEEKKIKEAEEAQKIAAQKAKEQEQKKKTEEASEAEQQTHTVQSTDNLYRIAIKYYGDGSQANIDKIKKANNLTSDSISTGQVLIINP